MLPLFWYSGNLSAFPYFYNSLNPLHLLSLNMITQPKFKNQSAILQQQLCVKKDTP